MSAHVGVGDCPQHGPPASHPPALRLHTPHLSADQGTNSRPRKPAAAVTVGKRAKGPQVSVVLGAREETAGWRVCTPGGETRLQEAVERRVELPRPRPGEPHTEQQ